MEPCRWVVVVGRRAGATFRLQTRLHSSHVLKLFFDVLSKDGKDNEDLQASMLLRALYDTYQATLYYHSWVRTVPEH
jgi:hypothetical protein